MSRRWQFNKAIIGAERIVCYALTINLFLVTFHFHWHWKGDNYSPKFRPRRFSVSFVLLWYGDYFNEETQKPSYGWYLRKGWELRLPWKYYVS